MNGVITIKPEQSAYYLTNDGTASSFIQCSENNDFMKYEYLVLKSQRYVHFIKDMHLINIEGNNYFSALAQLNRDL